MSVSLGDTPVALDWSALASLGQLATPATAKGPLPICHWILPGLVLAGGFPSEPGPQDKPSVQAKIEGKIRALVNSGIDTFVCLMEAEEIQRYGFNSYEPAATKVFAERASGSSNSSTGP
jgi:hypothetical protein